MIPRWYLVLCHFAVPLIFAWTTARHMRNPVFLRWEVVVLVTALSLPFLLPLFALYIKGIGKEGITFNNVFSKKVSAETVRSAEAEFQDPASQSKAPSQISDLGIRARKVLRTLWHFQRQEFGEVREKRWGFGVHPSARDYIEFRAGATRLLNAGLIAEDRRGLVFLSEIGMDFCSRNQKELGDGGDIWTTFGAA